MRKISARSKSAMETRLRKKQALKTPTKRRRAEAKAEWISTAISPQADIGCGTASRVLRKSRYEFESRDLQVCFAVPKGICISAPAS
jgi:hypothetical protein